MSGLDGDSGSGLKVRFFRGLGLGGLRGLGLKGFGVGAFGRSSALVRWLEAA